MMFPAVIKCISLSAVKHIYRMPSYWKSLFFDRLEERLKANEYVDRLSIRNTEWTTMKKPFHLARVERARNSNCAFPVPLTKVSVALPVTACLGSITSHSNIIILEVFPVLEFTDA